MASRALGQLFTDANWELDFMLIDLPPGTGDIHLSLVQDVPLTGAVVVSTPQEVALADARKGVGMFRLDTINVPVLGLIENMAYFVPPDMPTAVMTFSDGMGPSDWRRMSMRRSWAKCRWCNPSEKPETRAVRPYYKAITRCGCIPRSWLTC